MFETWSDTKPDIPTLSGLSSVAFCSEFTRTLKAFEYDPDRIKILQIKFQTQTITESIKYISNSVIHCGFAVYSKDRIFYIF